jgi:hypothetical protein
MEEEDVILLLHVSLYLIQWLSPVDVGGYAEPRKNCVGVLYPPMSNYQYTPGPRMGESEFPNNSCKDPWAINSF